MFSRIQFTAFVLLLVFTPVAKGSTPRWAFCAALWLALVSFSAMVLKRTGNGATLLPRTSLNTPIALLVVWGALSLCWSMYPGATVWAQMRLLLYVAVFFTALDLSLSRKRLKILVWVITSVGTAVALAGIIKYGGGFGPDGQAAAQPPTIFFVNRNHFAGYLAMVSALMLGVAFHKPFGNGLAWSLLPIPALWAFCLSLSRGAWLGLFAGVVVITALYTAKRTDGRRKATLAGLGLLCMLCLTPLVAGGALERIRDTRDVTERFVVWKGCASIIGRHPLTGTGLGTFPWSFAAVRPEGVTTRYYDAHNDYLHIVAETGFPVLIPLAWGLFVLLGHGVRTHAISAGRLSSAVALGALGSAAYMLVHSLVDFSMQITANGVLFSTLAAMMMSRPERESSYGNGRKHSDSKGGHEHAIHEPDRPADYSAAGRMLGQ